MNADDITYAECKRATFTETQRLGGRVRAGMEDFGERPQTPS